ncbi:MAG: hypothetical protein R3222_09010 [Balneolaceae bacterium]|nr:hypothetical protein [Balneolaceae bacterium]
MKKSGIVLLSLLLFPFLTLAQGSIYKSGSLVQVQEADSIQKQLIAAGETVEMSGWLGNDFLSAGRFMMLKGMVSDDAFIAGQQVIIDGEIGDLLVSAGETIIVNGVIRGDAFLGAREIRITEGARIEGNAVLGGATVVLEGAEIGGWLKAAGDELRLTGQIGEFTDLYSNYVTFGEEYVASLGTTITSEETVYRENLGVVPADLTLNVQEEPVVFIILSKIIFYLSVLITGMILLRIFQKTALDIHKFATEKFWKNTGVGLLTFIGVPLAVVLLLLPVLTIPLSILLLLVYLLALFIGYLLVALTLGVMAILYFRGEPKVSTYYWGLALGMIIIAILTNLPFIGFVLNAVLLFFGLGSLSYYIWLVSTGKKSAGTVQ